MDIIPKEQIKAYLFPFLTEKEGESAADEGNFKSMGYQSSNILLNMGTVFIMILAFAFIAFLLVLSWVLIKKYERVRRIYLLIHGKIFYSSFLRALLKGYLNFVVATMMSLTSV